MTKTNETSESDARAKKALRHEYYINRRQAALAYQREYNRTHKEKRKAYLKEYRERKKKPVPEEE